MFAEQLGFPPVFAGVLATDGEFSGRYVYSKLKQTFALGEISRIALADRLEIWSGYFDPL